MKILNHFIKFIRFIEYRCGIVVQKGLKNPYIGKTLNTTKDDVDVINCCKQAVEEKYIV